MVFVPLPVTAIDSYEDLLQVVWNCIPYPEVSVLVSLAEGYLSPGSPIPEGEVRAPFEDITPAWAGQARLANFEALWGITYQEFEIAGITLEVATATKFQTMWLWAMLQAGNLPYPAQRPPCETRSFPR